MRNVLTSLIIALSVMGGWSQTMNIHYKNGQIVQYNMDNIDYVEFSEQSNSQAQVSSGDAIDLGLSVLWASCNVGATSPEQYGNKYAWGETNTKKKYIKDNYLYYDGFTESYVNIGLDIKGTDYDVAHVKWGGKWRMPTFNELNELKKKCTWTWSRVNGINGYIVQGNNGNSIFFPVGSNDIGLWGSQISSSNKSGTSSMASITLFNSGSYTIGTTGLARYLGYYIRPVMPK